MSTFGAYRVLGKLGEGGMGAVFLAEHSLIGRRAAIKVLRAERSVTRDNVERFFNEARATSAVVDPGIVQVFDFGVTEDNTAYIVMEYLEGEVLLQRLRRLHRLAPLDALRIVRQVAGSLSAAHAAGIVHRDLKPENLFVVRDSEAPAGERVKILDFGIAKLDDNNDARMHTRPGSVMGTPVYMSPEQCSDTSKTDHRADIYSLGCVLYHLLTGVPPFDLHGFGAIAAAHLHDPVTPPSTLIPHLPIELDAVVLRCLEKAPGDRFQTMSELQHACDLLIAQLAALSAPTMSSRGYAPSPVYTTLGLSAGQPLPVSPRRLGRSIVLASIAIALGVGAAIATSGHKRLELPPASAQPTAMIVPRAAATIEPIAPVDAGIELLSPPQLARPPIPRLVKPTVAPKRVRAPISKDLYDDRT
ncbi:MAG TPA: serine/threonine-protein kinase [Kofleriaceae bacterium]|nr:serine/threonine-protein kinase [Kofleriaceae bacterium]